MFRFTSGTRDWQFFCVEISTAGGWYGICGIFMTDISYSQRLSSAFELTQRVVLYLICQKFWFIRSKACVYCIKTACNRLSIICTSGSSVRSKCRVWFLTIITCHIVHQLLDLTRCVMHQWLQKFLYDQTLAWLFRSEKIHFGRPYISFVVLQLGNQLFFERHDGYDFDEERYFCWTM